MKKIIVLLLFFCLVASVSHAEQPTIHTGRFYLAFFKGWSTAPILVDTERGIAYMTSTKNGGRWIPILFDSLEPGITLPDGVTASNYFLEVFHLMATHGDKKKEKPPEPGD